MCFILQKSLPLLRQSLVTKEIVIEGIQPPTAQIAFGGTMTAGTIPVRINFFPKFFFPRKNIF